MNSPSGPASAASVGVPLHNLPLQRSSFIGREQELRDIRGLFASSPLVTLIGAGGCGKTRLALRVAEEALPEYPDGVWFVDLAPLAESSLVSQAVAAALGVREDAGKPLLQTLLNHLKPKTTLLVLDNCEHLLNACAQLTDRLLKVCPDLHILATSREVLGITEQTYRVPSLPVPPPNHLPPLDELRQFPAISLFVDRARLIQTFFRLTDDNARIVAQICHRLDGIPLAIELAAARVRSLAVKEINDRLDNRFRLLTGGSRAALPRQQTLRALIDWSYDLLTPQEQAMLQRLSVFAGGWTLEATEEVCTDVESDPNAIQNPKSKIQNGEVLDLLTSLADKSLVMVEEREEGTRHRMLESLRQYAAEKLQEGGEGDVVRGRHRDHFLALAREAEPQLTGADQAAWLDRLELERDNLRAALDWSQSKAGEEVGGLQLANALAYFWEVRGDFSEGRARLTELLRRSEAGEMSAERARAYHAVGLLAWYQGDLQIAEEMQERSLEICRARNDRPGVAAATSKIGDVAYARGDYNAAFALHTECLALYRQNGDRHAVAAELTCLGNIRFQTGDYEAASAFHAESLEIARALGDKRLQAFALSNLAGVSFVQEQYDLAVSYEEQGLKMQRELGSKRGIAVDLNNLAELERMQGRPESALARQAESLLLLVELGDRRNVAVNLYRFAVVAMEGEQWESAARLYAALQRLCDEIGAPLPSASAEAHRANQYLIRKQMGEEGFRDAWQEGMAYSLAQAADYAVSIVAAKG